MRLHIEHTTTYSYARPVTLHRHRLVLRPREGHDLRVERMRLDVAPACRVDWVRDVFGNSIALVDFLEPADTLTIVSDVVLERLSPFPTRERHEPWHVPFPPRYDPLEAAITAVYLQSTYLDDVPAVQTWLRAEAPARSARRGRGHARAVPAHPRRDQVPAARRERRPDAGADRWPWGPDPAATWRRC